MFKSFFKYNAKGDKENSSPMRSPKPKMISRLIGSPCLSPPINQAASTPIAINGSPKRQREEESVANTSPKRAKGTPLTSPCPIDLSPTVDDQDITIALSPSHSPAVKSRSSVARRVSKYP